MLRHHISFKTLVCTAMVAASCLSGSGRAHCQDDGISVSLSDDQTTPKPALPRLSDDSVFRWLVQGYAREKEAVESPQAEPTSPAPVPHTPSAATTLAAVQANQEIIIQDVPLASPGTMAVGPDARFGDAATVVGQYERPEGIAPLTDQSKLFNSLWGKNADAEADSRFLVQQQTFAPGLPTRLFTDEQYGSRMIAPSSYTWAAPAFFHRPLYFEQVNLERYGQGPPHCLQPAFSAAHFFGTIPLLPYHLGATPRCESVYVLGHYRPGNCAPYQWHSTRDSWRGFFYQTAAMASFGALP